MHNTKLLWADAPFILSLARGSSFVSAAHDLGVDRTTVARRLERLEAQLGAMLFKRVSGKLELTRYGRKVMSFVEKAEQELSQLNVDQKDQNIAGGRVRVSVSQHVLAGFAKQIRQFIVKHPGILLELTTSDRFVDLYKYEADIVLRIAKTRPDKLHSVDLGIVNFRLYSHIEQPDSVDTLLAYPGQSELPKQMRPENNQAKIVAAVEGVLPTRDMIIAGAGAGVLPSFIGQSDMRLRPCSPKSPTGRYRLYMCCLPAQRTLSRIQMVMENLACQIAAALKEFDE